MHSVFNPPNAGWSAKAQMHAWLATTHFTGKPVGPTGKPPAVPGCRPRAHRLGAQAPESIRQCVGTRWIGLGLLVLGVPRL